MSTAHGFQLLLSDVGVFLGLPPPWEPREVALLPRRRKLVEKDLKELAMGCELSFLCGVFFLQNFEI